MMLRKTARPQYSCRKFYFASMRPQHDAAENSYADCGRRRLQVASMRPQHDAAENVPHKQHVLGSLDCFNEAAA